MTDPTGPLGSRLTDDAQAIARTATIDLGLGYPQLAHPPWLRHLLVTGVDPALAYSSSSRWSAAADAALDAALLEAACRCLGIDEHHAANGLVTFSGSVALDRVLASQLGAGGSVVITSPSVDMVSAMISEHPGAQAVCVPTTAPGFHLDVDAVAASLLADTRSIVIASPDNPSGNVVVADQMHALVTLAMEHDVTLVVDQCFALINPHSIDIPVLAEFATPGLRWVMLWDTGKTFGLNHEKLGFVLCSPEVLPGIRERLNVLQYDVSRRQKLLFRAVLDQAHANRWFDELSTTVAANLELVHQASLDVPLVASSPDAGSLTLLDVTEVAEGMTGSVFAGVLLADKGVGVIRAADFFHPLAPSGVRQPGHDHFVRVALAREPAQLETGMDAVVGLCRELASARSIATGAGGGVDAVGW